MDKHPIITNTTIFLKEKSFILEGQ